MWICCVDSPVQVTRHDLVLDFLEARDGSTRKARCLATRSGKVKFKAAIKFHRLSRKGRRLINVDCSYSHNFTFLFVKTWYILSNWVKNTTSQCICKIMYGQCMKIQVTKEGNTRAWAKADNNRERKKIGKSTWGVIVPFKTCILFGPQ